MKLTCVVIDDEPSGRKVLEEFIAETDYLKPEGSFSNPLKALPLLSSGTTDLLFLDVQMPQINGIDFLRSLFNPPMVIVTSAYSEYALQGFELDVIDYLLKPVSFERFLKATQKAKQFAGMRQGKQDKGEAPAYFFIKCNNKFERILFEELLYVEAANNYVIIQTRERRLITYLTFKGIAGHLPGARFIKVHKSFIVAVDKIDSIDGEEIKIATHTIPISRGLKDEVMERVIKGNLLKR